MAKLNIWGEKTCLSLSAEFSNAEVFHQEFKNQIKAGNALICYYLFIFLKITILSYWQNGH